MHHTIVVIAEQQQQQLTQQSLEAIAAAQLLPSQQLIVTLVGNDLDDSIEQLIQLKIDALWSIDNPVLADYSTAAYISAFSQLLEQTKADLILLPHSYQSRDFVPAVAALTKRSIVSDVISFTVSDNETVFVRNLFQGRLHADVVLNGDSPHFVSIQAGCFKASAVEKNNAPCSVKKPDIAIEPSLLPVNMEAPMRPGNEAINLDAAKIIVAIGRGIKSADNIALVQKLATLLNAELAASRPICDEGWLPADRQIGTSGQSVAPSVYIAIGISGAIQHIIGMKSSATIVAINNDPNAPIFDIADYDIVADLFDIVPALINRLEGRGIA